MDVLFPTRPGVVGVLYGQDAMPVTVNLVRSDYAVSNVGLAAPPVMKAILTGFDLNGSGAVSVNLTLRQKIYALVVGGEKPGRLVLSGLWFPQVCPAPTGLTGIDTLMTLYEAVRLSTTGRTVFVTIARTLALVGVVKDFSARLADPNTGVGEFLFLLDYMPRGVLLKPLVGPLPLAPMLTASAVAGALRS